MITQLLIVSGILPVLAFSQSTMTTFRSEVRLIEVYATVLDKKGRHVNGLTRDSFEVLDNGRPQPIVAFESENSELACAILLDTTGSMEKSLPRLKNAVTRFIDELRPTDLVAIYSFSNSLRLLQDFTSEKSSAKRAVMRTRAAGGTALFDAIAQTVGAISGRNGRKALVVFTDGADNSSVLDSQAAVGRAKRAGIPVFAVAQGAARHSTLLAKLLSDISTATGGATFEAGRIQAIDKVFATVSTRLLHLYTVGYTAPAPENDAWRTIIVNIRVNHKYEVRAREGYFPE